MGILLSAPITTKESTDGASATLSYGASAMQGWRTKMEDASCSELDIIKGVSLFGVYDGHGGDEVSGYVGRHIVSVIKSSKAFAEKKYDQCLIDAYLTLDEMLASEEGIKELSASQKNSYSSRTTAENIGCTAVSCIIDEATSSIYVANSGDSRIVLCKNGKAVCLSTDHKPQLESESTRIAKAGGYIVNGRVNGNLNLCRAIGDQEYKKDKKLKPEEQIITAYPETRVVKIDAECEFLLLGCDGVWDVLSNDACVELVRKKLQELPATAKVSQVCEIVLDRCCAKEPSEIVGCDNISFTVVVFNKNFKRGTLAAIVSKTDSDVAME